MADSDSRLNMGFNLINKANILAEAFDYGHRYDIFRTRINGLYQSWTKGRNFCRAPVKSRTCS